MHNYSTIYKEIRDFLTDNDANSPVHYSRLIINQLAYGLYDDKEDQRVAIELAKDQISRGRHRKPNIMEDSEKANAINSPASFRSGESEKRMAHNVAMRLKDTPRKFIGERGDCWDEFVDNYIQLAKDYKLKDEQKLQYLHNPLCKDALCFYMDSVQSHARTFEETVAHIGDEYNTPVRQARMINHLSGLRVGTFIKEEMDITVALAKI